MKRITMKVAFGALLFTLGAGAAGLEPETPPAKIFAETAEQKAERLKWWTDGRFGMFIHFGLYAMPARHEWVRSIERIPNETYDAKYLPRFDPDLFDARDWARRAKAASMKYMVLTTKHHEGFCMWDTKTTDYKITRTPFGRDLVKEFADACRAEGLHVGFYFSIIDWHHPDFTIDPVHPLRPRETYDADGKAKPGFTPESYAKLNEGRDMARYREYMYAQVRELLTEYGKIDIMWFDYTSKGEYGKSWRDWDSVRLLKMARGLQPQIIVDNRLDLLDTEDGFDFVTPEQFKVSEWPKWKGKKTYWETCQTFSGSWGYHRDESTWKSPHQLIELLVHTVSFGGNLIMNVGPTARGEFDERAQDRLAAFGRWMHWNSRSIYGCTQAPEEFTRPEGTLMTYNPERKRLYVHLVDYPMGALAFEFYDRVAYAQFLHDGSEVNIVAPGGARHGQMGEMRIPGKIVLPVVKPNVEVPVIEFFLK